MNFVDLNKNRIALQKITLNQRESIDRENRKNEIGENITCVNLETKIILPKKILLMRMGEMLFGIARHPF